jgi:hypothetical protein
VIVSTTFAPAGLQGTGIDVQLGAQQRSHIHYVDVLFNSEVGLSDLLLLNPLQVERFALDATKVTPGTGAAVNGFVVNNIAEQLWVRRCVHQKF